MARVSFVDTSILCNLVPVPGRCQHIAEVKRGLVERVAAHTVLILPVTSVVETGNFIRHLENGSERRTAATRFVEILEFVAADKAPWSLHRVAWDESFLEGLVEGANTGTSFVEHAVSALGCGDLCILQEVETYILRTGIEDVDVWTRDGTLGAYARN